MPPANTQTFECDSCEATYRGSLTQLTRDQHWVRHVQHARQVLLCKACEEMYATRRKLRRKLDELDQAA